MTSRVTYSVFKNNVTDNCFMDAKAKIINGEAHINSPCTSVADWRTRESFPPCTDCLTDEASWTSEDLGELEKKW